MSCVESDSAATTTTTTTAALATIGTAASGVWCAWTSVPVAHSLAHDAAEVRQHVRGNHSAAVVTHAAEGQGVERRSRLAVLP
jgi:hypothetical protein